MRLTIPFTYTAEVMVGRSAKPRREMFVDELIVEVPEYCDEDVPVAMTVATQYNTGQRPPRDVYRYRDGRFYMFDTPRWSGAFSKDELVQAHGHSRADQLGKMFDHANYQASQRALGEWFRNPGYLRQKTPRADQVAEWRYSGREKALEEARSFGSRLAFVGGKLWFAVEEPKLATGMAFIPFVSVSSQRFEREIGAFGDPVTNRLFCVNDVDAARRFCIANEVQHVTFEWNSINVSMPDVFTFDPARHALEWVADVALDTLGCELGTSSAHVVSDWIDLRAMLRERRDDAEWESCLAAAVGGILPQLSRQDIANHLNLCLDQWNMNVRSHVALPTPVSSLRL